MTGIGFSTSDSSRDDSEEVEAQGVTSDSQHGASIAAVLDRAKFSSDGLLPAIIQEEGSRDVLMLGYMDAEALRRTLTEGRVTFWSRSRQEYWRKGDTSGHSQFVRAAAFDCDADTLLVTVEQVGAACHTGAHACFDTDPLQPLVTDLSPNDGDGIEGHAE